MAKQAQTKVSVLILGESHCTAISRALGGNFEGEFMAIDVRAGADETKINFDLLSDLMPDKLVLAFGGTEHNIIGLIEAEPKFDFIWPPFDDFDVGKCLVPANAIEEVLRQRLQSGLGRALMVRQRFAARPTYALAPPPPFRAMDDKATLPKAFAELIEAGIAPASVRRKFYAVQCEMMRRAYAKHGIQLISAPGAATDEDGYLLRNLWNRDPTHGNPAYGRLVVENLREKLDV
jgi:hypothetical protein